MTNRMSLRGAGLAVALTMAVGGMARADEAADKAQLEQRVKDLERELGEVKSSLRGGYFTANSDLEARVGELERMAAGDSAMSGMFKSGLRHEGGDGEFRYQWFGLIQHDSVWYWDNGDDDYNDLFQPGFEFRRVRLGAMGRMYGNVRWHSEVDFAGGEVTFADMWMELEGCAIGNIRVGHQKEPIGFDTLTSDRYMQFMERGFVNSLAPVRNTGIMVHGNCMDDQILYQVGIFRDTNSAGDDGGNAKAGEYNFSGRLSGRPLIEDDGTTWLHLGASARYEDVADDAFTRALTPALSQIGSVSASAAADTAWQFGLEAAYCMGPWTFLGEYGSVTADMVAGGDADIDAYSLEGAYWLTGENTVYDKAKGTFGRTSPKSNFGDGDSCGAWQLALRYDHIKADKDFGIGGGLGSNKADQWTVGLRWWLNPNTAIHANVARIDPDDLQALTAIGVRFEIDF